MAKSASQIGKDLKAAREASGLTQAEAAAALGLGSQTISRWERGEHSIKTADYNRAMELFRAQSSNPNRLGENVPRGTFGGDGDWAPNPSLKAAIPPRAHDLAVDYCRRLVRAGLAAEEVSELERVMIDSRYAKANRRAGRDLSEDDWILLVEDAWNAIRESLGIRGLRV